MTAEIGVDDSCVRDAMWVVVISSYYAIAVHSDQRERTVQLLVGSSV